MKASEKLRILDMIAGEAAYRGAIKYGANWHSRHGEKICSDYIMRHFVDMGYVKIWARESAHITPHGDDVLKNLREEERELRKCRTK